MAATAAATSPTTPPGDLPWAVHEGTITGVIVDVSGEAYVDLERESMGMMSRD